MYLRLFAALFACLSLVASARAQTQPPEVVAGRDWLLAQVRGDGSIAGESGTLATTRQTRAETLETLARLNVAPNSLLNRIAQDPPDSTVEHLARQILAMARTGNVVPAKLAELKALQNADGGFGGTVRHGSDALDTSFALVALRAANQTSGPELGRAVSYLAALSGPDNVALKTGARSKPYVSAYALLALQSHAQEFSIAAAVEAARTRLIAQQDQGVYGETLLDAVGAIALGFSSTSGAGLDSLRSALRASQLPNGSWANDPYLTALALRALVGSGTVAPPTTAQLAALVRDAQTLAPIAGAALTLTPGASQASSAGDGRISLAGIAPGSYAIAIAKAGYRPAQITGVALNAGQLLDLGNVDLVRVATDAVLRGQVTDVRDGSPLAGARIAVAGAATAELSSGPDGRYEWSGAAAGAVTIVVSHDGFRSVSAEGTLVVGSTLLFSPALYPVSMEPPGRAVLSGRIVSAQDDGPIAGATVAVGTASIASGSDGRFSLIDLPTGSFSASIAAGGFHGASLAGTLAAGVNDAGIIRLAPDLPSDLSSLSGRITDAANGTPVANASIAITGTALRVSSGADGRYRIENIVAVPFSATVTAPGYASQSLSAGQQGHGNFSGDVALSRLTGGNLTLDSVVVSAAEFEPYAEVGVVGTVRNHGSSEAGLIFNAVVFDAQQRIVRDVPAVRLVANSRPGDNVLGIGANATRAVTITWGNLGDAPGDYSVLFRGVDAQGQVAVEGSAGYRVRAARRIGGGIVLDPPLLQAGLGQAVNMDADLVNLGNQDIAAGETELTVKLVRADSKPAFPAVPTMQTPLATSPTLNGPVGGGRDAAGNFYTVSYNSLDVFKIDSAGAITVMGRLSQYVGPNNSTYLGRPIDLRLHADGKLRIVWSYGYITTLATSGPFAPTFAAGPTSSATAYYLMPDGTEYFFGTYQSRHRLVKRTPAGQVSVLIDGDGNNMSQLVLGPGGHLYAGQSSTGDIMRIDRDSGTVSVFVAGFGQIYGMAFDAAGNLYASDGYAKVRKRTAAGAISDFAVNLPSPMRLLFGNDGQLYVLCTASGTSSIRRIDASGNVSVFAQGLVSAPTGIAFHADGQMLAINASTLRRRNSDGTTSTLIAGMNSASDLLAKADGSVLVSDGPRLRRHDGSGASVVYQGTAGAATLGALSEYPGADALVGALVDGIYGLFRVQGGALQPVARATPSTLYGTAALANGEMALLGYYSLWVLGTDSIPRQVTTLTNAQMMAQDPAGAVYVYDSNRMLRIDMATGAKTQVAGAIQYLAYGFDVDAQGRIVYANYVTRQLVRYDPVANAYTVLATFPGTSEYGRQVVLDAADVPYTRSNNYRVYRYDGAGLVQVSADAETELVVSRGGRPYWRKETQVYSVDANGNAQAVINLATRPTSTFAPLDDGSLFVPDASVARFDHFEPDGTLRRRAYWFNTVGLVAAKGEDIYFVDTYGSSLMRLRPGQPLERVTVPLTFQMREHGGDIYLTQTDGIRRVNADLSTTVAHTVSAFGSGEYGYFDIAANGDLALVNRTTTEQSVWRGNTRLHSYQPFTNTQAFVQRSDGSWLVAGDDRMIEIDAQGNGATLLNRINATVRQMTRAPDGTIYAVRVDANLYKVGADGRLVNVAPTASNPNIRFNHVLADAAGVFAASGTPTQIFRLQEGWLQPFAGGVSTVGAIAVGSDGRVFISDDDSQSVGEVANGSYRQIAAGFSKPESLALWEPNTLVIGLAYDLAVSDLDGRWSAVRAGNYTMLSGLVVGADGSLISADYYGNSVVRAQLQAAPPPVAVGSIVHTQRRPHGALDRNARLPIDYGNWTPQVGGDYEVRIVSTDSDTGGSLVAGLHVGPHARADMAALPSRSVPGDQMVEVRTKLEGADFSSVSRIETSQLQLAMPQAIYPPAMALDATGALWYQNTYLYRLAPGQAAAELISNQSYYATRGEVPIDSQQRAYVSSQRYVSSAGRYFSDIRRFDAQRNGAVVGSIDGTVVSMTIDELDRIYAVVQGKVFRMSPAGEVELYAALPADAPYGITRDGQGNLYVQLQNNKIVRVDPDRQTSMLLTDATFEYEGVNITGTCSEGLFFTPITYTRVGQNGEEYTVAQVVGSTGQIGPIINGRMISDDLTDIDFLVYDRFASNLLLMSESNGPKLFRVPVTCGAIDVDLHVVLKAGQSALALDPPPQQNLVRADGSTELVWSLRQLNRQGVEISFKTLLQDLRRGEDRPVAREAFLEFRNSFGPAPVRVPVRVASVHVDDLVDIAVRTDRPSYPQRTAVQIDVDLVNRDAAQRDGRLVVSVVDAAGEVAETLLDRPEHFAGNDVRVLHPPFNTATHRAGPYRVLARILDNGGNVVAEASTAFEITAGSGGPTLGSSIATDKPAYNSGETARLLGSVVNDSANQGFSQLTVVETVFDPAGTVFWSGSHAVPNLEPAATVRFEFELALGSAVAGTYSVRQEVRASDGTVLSVATTTFEVRTSAGNEALSGTLAVDPAVVQRGRDAALLGKVSNRGNAALAAVPLRLRVLDPAAGNAVVAEWSFSRDIAAGATVELPQNWNTAGAALKPYVAVLVAEIGGDSRVLAQQTLRVVSVVLQGTLQATPETAVRGTPVALAATVVNAGNLGALGLPLQLRVYAAGSQALQREWSYSADLRPAAQASYNESLDTQTLPLGAYVARWSATVDGAEQLLAEDGFVVSGSAIGGSVSATPAAVEIGQPVALAGVVRNTGNAVAAGQPIRLEVRRRDTQSVVASWNDTRDIAAQGAVQIDREFATTSATAGDYDAVLLAQVGGSWETLATAYFSVTSAAAAVELDMLVQRDARVLVLASCAPGESSFDGSIQPGGNGNGSVCERERKAFIESWLSQRGILHKVVLDAAEFMAELRCGRYNVYWLSGGSAKLANADALELRETIYRGEGLLQDASHDQRNSLVDEIAGYAYRGHNNEQDQNLSGAGTLFPAVSVATIGRNLRLETTSGQVEATFSTSNTPASISNTYGQGHALIHAFDLARLLRRDGQLPATARLFDSALVFVAPTVVNADFARGSTVPVTTAVSNRGQAVDLRLGTSVVAPFAIESAQPTASSSDPQRASWDFSLAAQAERQFDVGVRLPLAGGSDNNVRSELARRSAGTLQPLANRVLPLPLRDAPALAQQLIAQLSGANLQGGEAAARNRAVQAITDARALEQQDKPLQAIARWIDAAGEIVRIQSLSPAAWRLANARLLEVTQRRACGVVATPGGCNSLGIAADYNGFFFEGFSAQSSDVQGRLAAGGSVSINNYSIADQLPASFSGASLVVGGNLTFPSGRVYHGDIVVGGSAAGVGAAVLNGLGATQHLYDHAALPIDFAAERTRLTAESQRLAQLAANTTYESQWGGLYLHGDNSSSLQVFNLPGQLVLDAHTFQVDRIPAGATVLFNISGTTAGLTDMSLQSLLPYRTRVLFNFPQATTLQLRGISVEGSVLAPLAAINDPQGVIWGTVVAKSWNGMMQVNLAAHEGCTAATTAAPPSGQCAANPPTPELVADASRFIPFALKERLEVRGGKRGNADWEWGLGSRTGTSGQYTPAQLVWSSGKVYRFTLGYDGGGNGSYRLWDGSTQLLNQSFSGSAGSALRTGNALQLVAAVAADSDPARIKISPRLLDGLPLATDMETVAGAAASEMRQTYYFPGLGNGFELEGTLRFYFNGNNPPEGTRMSFTVNAGNLTCDGATP